VLLDIKMRDGNGFEVVEAVAQRPNPPLIIFVTAFDQYAAQAFDSAVTDYLLKPVERERLARALLKAERQLHIKDAELRVDELQQVLRNLRAARNGDGQQEFETEFWLRGSGGLVRVPVDAIDCVSSDTHGIGIAFDARFNPPICRACRARPVRPHSPPLAGPAKRDQRALYGQNRPHRSSASQRQAPARRARAPQAAASVYPGNDAALSE
jgi:CheY-like chemotaxis protein